MTQQFHALAALVKDLHSVPTPMWSGSQPPKTTAPGDPPPSSGLHQPLYSGAQRYTQSKDKEGQVRWLSRQKYLLCKPSGLSLIPRTHKGEKRLLKSCPWNCTRAHTHCIHSNNSNSEYGNTASGGREEGANKSEAN